MLAQLGYFAFMHPRPSQLEFRSWLLWRPGPGFSIRMAHVPMHVHTNDQCSCSECSFDFPMCFYIVLIYGSLVSLGVFYDVLKQHWFQEMDREPMFLRGTFTHYLGLCAFWKPGPVIWQHSINPFRGQIALT